MSKVMGDFGNFWEDLLTQPKDKAIDVKLEADIIVDTNVNIADSNIKNVESYYDFGDDVVNYETVDTKPVFNKDEVMTWADKKVVERKEEAIKEEAKKLQEVEKKKTNQNRAGVAAVAVAALYLMNKE
jgi:hypothetical protein